MTSRPQKKRKYSNKFSTKHQPPRTNYIYLAFSNNTIEVLVYSVGSMIYECVQCQTLHLLGKKIKNYS